MLNEQETRDYARQVWDDTLKEHPVEDNPNRPYPYWLDTFTSIYQDGLMQMIGNMELDEICKCGRPLHVTDLAALRCRECYTPVSIKVGDPNE